MSTEKIADRFKRDTVQHEMTVLHDDGLYRHLRFQRTYWRPPLLKQQRSSIYWFDLITVPGALIFRGDGESFVFARLADMFEFFRGGGYDRTPNFSYWAEKLTDDPARAMRYDQELLTQWVEEELKNHYEGSTVPEALAEEVRWKVLNELTGDQSVDLKLVYDFRWWADPMEEHRYPRKGPDFEFMDVSEWSVRGYTWWFQWACHAIVWGIAKYDEHRAKAVA